MNRTQKLKMNTRMSLLNRVTIMLSGLILPRLILLHYGSEVNGLVASLSQFLSIITFLDLGVGSVVQSALYKPLANKNSREVSEVLFVAKKYFRKIAFILLVYVCGLIIFYPKISSQDLNDVSTSFLIIAISINIFAQFYFGIINELLLNADQRAFVQLGTEILVVVLNLIVSVFFITQGFSIQFVKFTTSFIYIIRPVYLNYYVKKHFNINYNIKVDKDPLPQKWNGMGQHIAYSIQNSTDIIVLTIFSTLDSVSVYSVYNLIAQSIRLLIQSFTTGLTSFFGNLLAKNEIAILNKYFSEIEWVIHTIVIYLYGMTAVLISSFVMLYTSGIKDVNYYAPVFGLLLVLAGAAFSLRTPYQSLIHAAGHYKQTQLSSIVEASINIVISLIMVNKFGLIGVTIGTLVSMVYRTLYLIKYLSNNLVKRPIKIFAKQIFVDALTFGLMIVAGKSVTKFIDIHNLLDWIILAVILGIIFFLLSLLINIIFYKKYLLNLISRIFRKNRVVYKNANFKK